MKTRLRLLNGLFSIVPIVFLMRLGQIQILDTNDFVREADNNRYLILETEAPRGNIYDRNGELLVTWRNAFDLDYTATSRAVDGNVVKTLSGIIGDSSSTFSDRIRAAHKSPGRPVRLVNDISAEALASLSWNARTLKEIRMLQGFERKLPQDSFAAHLIGYIGEVSEADLSASVANGLRPGDRVGKSGLERKFDAYLRGHSGLEKYESDPLGRARRRIGARAAEPGADLHLTIDAALQRSAEAALAGKIGAVVAIEPATGRILAMASAPAYSPEIFSNHARQRERIELLNDPTLPLMSRALTGTYPPGSIFKIVTLLAGLSEGTIHAEDAVVCEGIYKGQRCWKSGGHGRISMIEAFAQSCNVYFYQMGERVGIEAIARTARAFGWESPPTLGIGPEKSGVVPTPEWKRENIRGPEGAWWGSGDVRNTAIGQGFVLATPFQIARLYGSIFSHGNLMRLGAVEEIRGASGDVLWKFDPEIESSFPLDPRHENLLRKAFLSVVDEGTARRIRRDFPIGAKTGTAQNPHGEDHAWMVAAWPLNEESPPKVVAVALVVNGGHGSSAAGPIIGTLIDAWSEAQEAKQ